MNVTTNTVSNTPVITIQEPGAKATNAQLRVIGHAVKENQLERFDENAWKNMTKGQAAEIITKLYANHGELPASQAQKTKLGDLIRRGFLKGLKRETYQNLTSSQVSDLSDLSDQTPAVLHKVIESLKIRLDREEEKMADVPF